MVLTDPLSVHSRLIAMVAIYDAEDEAAEIEPRPRLRTIRRVLVSPVALDNEKVCKYSFS